MYEAHGKFAFSSSKTIKVLRFSCDFNHNSTEEVIVALLVYKRAFSCFFIMAIGFASSLLKRESIESTR